MGLNCIGSIVSGDWTNYCTVPIRRGQGNLKGKAKYSSKHRVFVGTWGFRKLRASPPGSPPLKRLRQFKARLTSDSVTRYFFEKLMRIEHVTHQETQIHKNFSE